MAFRSVNFQHLARFNSAAASKFIDLYDEAVNLEICKQNESPSHQTFAPSSMLCDRIQWFRLRGVQPDTVVSPDAYLDFTAKIGQECHKIIQSRIKDNYPDIWTPVPKYLSENPIPYKYSMQLSESGLEYLIEVENPPVRFAVDGILFIDGEYYLLEIKSSEFASFNDLVEPKPHHVDQAKTYGSLLNIHKVLFVYIDRQYGNIKVYEVRLTDSDVATVKSRMTYVLDMVEKQLIPDPLPKNHQHCTPSLCPYYRSCQSWGR